MGNATRLVRPRTVTGDGEGLVSRGGLVWLGEVADRSGLTAGLSQALAEVPRRRHDPGVGLAQLVALADGAECLSDLDAVITGIPGSGKSTVADLLARRFERGVHVKGDVFRRMVVAGREEMTSTPSAEAWHQLRLRYRLAAATADAFHETGFSVVVQDVVIGSVLADYVEAIHSRPRVVVVLAPRPDVVAKREAARSKVAYRDGFDDIDVLDRVLRYETPHLGLWLDSSDQHPEQTATEIAERGLEDGLID